VDRLADVATAGRHRNDAADADRRKKAVAVPVQASPAPLANDPVAAEIVSNIELPDLSAGRPARFRRCYGLAGSA
jgi:hypothetical protein